MTQKMPDFSEKKLSSQHENYFLSDQSIKIIYGLTKFFQGKIFQKSIFGHLFLSIFRKPKYFWE
jgi:hypothetical protein